MLGLLARDDDVHVVLAAQAVVGDREQRVRVRWKIDAHDLGALVRHVVEEARILMAEAIVVLPPDVRGEQVVQRGDRLAPRDMPSRLQPLRVLIEHRVYEVNERLIAGEEAVSAGEQIALQPALTLMLTQHLDDPSVERESVIRRDLLLGVDATRRLEDGIPAVRRGLVGAEDAERLGVALDDVADEPALLARRLRLGRARRRDLHCVVAEVGQREVTAQHAAVRVRVGAHAALTRRRPGANGRQRRAVRVEELLGAIAAHPRLEDRDVLGFVHVAHRHLV